MKLHWEVEGPYETLKSTSATDVRAEYDRLLALGETPILYEVVGNDYLRIDRNWLSDEVAFERIHACTSI